MCIRDRIKVGRTTPRLMTAATTGMVIISVALTVFAAPLYEMSTKAGENLEGLSLIHISEPTRPY